MLRLSPASAADRGVRWTPVGRPKLATTSSPPRPTAPDVARLRTCDFYSRLRCRAVSLRGRRWARSGKDRGSASDKRTKQWSRAQPPRCAALPNYPLQPRLPRRCASGGRQRSPTCATSGHACSPPRSGGWTPYPPDAPTPPRSSTLTSPAVTCLGWIWGVLRDMPGIRDRASAKLAHKEVQCRKMLLSSYKEMVLAVSDLVKASRAMRCFSKASLGSPLVRFTDPQDDLKESGDGGGAPVFKLISISEFEDFAQELVEMFVSELQLKRLLVLELLSINIKEGADPSLEWSDELYDGALYEFRSTVRRSIDSCPLPENWRTDVLQARLPGCTPSHEVYLTSWLANGNIKMSSDIQLAVQLDARKGTMDFAGDTQKNIASMRDPELTKVLVRLSEGNSCLIVVDDPKARGFNVAMFSCNEKSKLGRFDHPKARGYC